MDGFSKAMRSISQDAVVVNSINGYYYAIACSHVGYGFERKLYGNGSELNKVTFKTTQKIRGQPRRSVSSSYNRTIVYFKGRLATLKA